MSPYFKYQQASASSNNKIQQLVFVFDEITRSLYQAQKSINDNNAEGKHRNLSKAIEIFYDLCSIVNIERGGKIAKHFNSFIILSIQKLQDLNFNDSDIQGIEDITRVIRSVRNVLASAMADCMNSYKE